MLMYQLSFDKITAMLVKNQDERMTLMERRYQPTNEEDIFGDDQEMMDEKMWAISVLIVINTRYVAYWTVNC